MMRRWSSRWRWPSALGVEQPRRYVCVFGGLCACTPTALFLTMSFITSAGDYAIPNVYVQQGPPGANAAGGDVRGGPAVLHLHHGVRGRGAGPSAALQALLPRTLHRPVAAAEPRLPAVQARREHHVGAAPVSTGGRRGGWVDSARWCSASQPCRQSRHWRGWARHGGGCGCRGRLCARQPGSLDAGR